MLCRRRLPRLLAAFVATLLALGAVVVGGRTPAAHAVGADDSIVGPSRVSAAQMTAWFRAKTTSPYAVSVPIDQLAALYIEEGNRAGVRGDIAFTQSILETRWFSFPAGGLLTASQNNFAGIGACDSCATGTTFASVQLGVRAQMQQLRRYADPNSRASNIGAPPVSPLWTSDAAYDVMNRTHGWAPTWQSLTGTWATAPSYAATINQLYNAMWNWAGRPGEVRWAGWEMPGGLGSFVPGGIAAGPASSSWAPGRLDVFATNTAGALIHKWWDGHSWSPGWESLGNPPSGGIVGNPSAVSWGPNRVDVFVRGTDDQLWTRVWTGSVWTNWSTLGGILTAAPAVASQGAGTCSSPATTVRSGVAPGPARSGRCGRRSAAWCSAARRRWLRPPVGSISSCTAATTRSTTAAGTARHGRSGRASAASSPPHPRRRRGGPVASTCS
jgi:hypothetical protein